MSQAYSKRWKKVKRKTLLHHAAGQVFGAAGITALSLGIVGAFVFTIVLAGPGLRSAQLAAVVTASLVDLTNQDRAQNQLEGLTVNPLLMAAAQAKANDMATKSYFAHTSPEGLNSWYWFKLAGYSFSYAGENLAVDFTDSATVNQAWMNSPEHRANILSSHFTDIGIAEAQGTYEGQETTFIVQMFGSPATDAAEADDDVLAEITPAVPTQMAFATTKSGASSTDVLGTSVATAPTPTTQASLKPATPPHLESGAPESAQSTTTTATSSIQSPSTVTPQNPPKYVPTWLSFLVASPENLLRAIYIVLGGLLLLALVIRTGFEFKKHHMRHVIAAIVLLVLMGGLLFTADRYIFVQPVLGSAASASV